MLNDLARLRNKLFAVSLRMQPVVIVIGDIEAPSIRYAVVDETVVKLSTDSTPLKAADICFKTCYVFHATYPVEILSWFLLQRLVYDVSTKRDVQLPQYICFTVRPAVTIDAAT